MYNYTDDLTEVTLVLVCVLVYPRPTRGTALYPDDRSAYNYTDDIPEVTRVLVCVSTRDQHVELHYVLKTGVCITILMIYPRSHGC